MARRLLHSTACAIFLLLPWTSPAAPARAVYFSDDASIRRLDPATLNTSVVFTNAIVAGRYFQSLQIDAENGHLYWIDSSKRVYRGNIDGTGATVIYNGSASNFSPKDLAVNPATGQIFLGIENSGIFELNSVSATLTPIFLAPSPVELFGPHLYFEPESDTLYFTDSGLATLRRKAPNTAIEFLGQLPVYFLSGQSGHSTDMVFNEFGTPIPYSVCRNAVLYVGGLDGNPAQAHPTANIVPNPSADLSVDAEGGFVYFGGGTYDGNGTYSGLYRMKLDGTEVTRIFATTVNRISVAVDVVDLADTDPPDISIFSPIGGNTNNQSASIIGSITDASSITAATWSHNGVAQGAVALFGGDFTVPAVSLVPGDNVLEIFATDLPGNTGSAQVILNWQPLRSVTISNGESVREGRRTNFDILLDSPGDVAGMTFTLHYDPVFFESPELHVATSIEHAAPTTNILTPGEITVTFANPIEPIPEGEQLLLGARLRARSVPSTTSSELRVSVRDLADSGGSPIVVGTYEGTSAIVILPRTYVGDSNSNDRLDTGDSTRMQAMLAGIAGIRAWDEAINDLNGSTMLDSGDVIRVLRAVVGIDPQPSPPPASPRAYGIGASDPDAPRARLTFSQNHAAVGEQVTVAVNIENTNSAFTGATFTLDYPIAALKLEGPASRAPGPLIAGDAFLLWNLAPSQNDYANQSGTISLGASSSTSWPGSSADGILATFTFTVQAGATSQALWPLTVRNAEVSTDSGFAIMTLTGDTQQFIGTPLTFSTWSAQHFTAAELADPLISAWDADADNDQSSNAIEFFTGTDPRDPDSNAFLSTEWIPGENDTQCLAVSYQRDLTSTGITGRLQVSANLLDWMDTEGEGTSWIDASEAIEFVTHQVPPPQSGSRRFVRLMMTPAIIPAPSPSP